jgi:hypothetical protein
MAIHPHSCPVVDVSHLCITVVIWRGINVDKWHGRRGAWPPTGRSTCTTTNWAEGSIPISSPSDRCISIPPPAAAPLPQPLGPRTAKLACNPTLPAWHSGAVGSCARGCLICHSGYTALHSDGEACILGAAICSAHLASNGRPKQARQSYWRPHGAAGI